MRNQQLNSKITSRYGPTLTAEVRSSMKSGKELKLAPMKYKDYTWMFNPTTTTYSASRSYVTHKYPELWMVEQEDMEANVVVISGSGEFFGPSAYLEWDRINTVYKTHGPGAFFHPVYKDITMALMTKLEGVVNPTGNYVSYTFEFVGSQFITDAHAVTPDPDHNSSLAPASSGSSGSGGGSTDNIYGISDYKYTVCSDDTLWGIAAWYYKDGSKYTTIYDANRDQLSNPDVISVGQVLTLP
jgi:hypothetical protein